MNFTVRKLKSYIEKLYDHLSANGFDGQLRPHMFCHVQETESSTGKSVFVLKGNLN